MNFLALREELRRKFNEICLEFDSVPPPQLLHYTSPTGFRGIVESATIWCTDIRHVNDPREGDHGFEVLKTVLQRKSVPKEFLEAVHRSQDLFGLKRLYTSYVASFSSGLEEAYLWTDYAAKGTGCALVFDYSALDEGAEEGRNMQWFESSTTAPRSCVRCGRSWITPFRFSAAALFPRMMRLNSGTQKWHFPC